MDLLPGGYWDEHGRLHRSFELSALTGREEELLTTGGTRETASLVTEVLCRCLVRLGDFAPVPPEVVRGLLVGDRQYLLLRLRQLTFGDVVRANLFCPWAECGARVSVSFSVADVPVVAPEERAPEFTVPFQGGTVTMRLPTGADQEDLAGQATTDDGVAVTRLLARCTRRDEDDVAALPASVRAELQDHLARLAPRVEQTMDVTCAECGRTFLAAFDIHRYLFGELSTDRELLYQEVHYLAFHYHWSEREIMSMPRDRRRTYIDVLGDAIEVLNSAG